MYVIGDIHGCWTALQALVDFVPIREDDMIITLGDYVDRGPDSMQVVEWVMGRTARGCCLPLRGNHEVMMIEAISGEIPMFAWLQFGGRETLHSYAEQGKRGEPEDVPLAHLQFLESELLPFYETKSHIFVHATASPYLSMERQSPESLYWDRFSSLRPHQSGKIVVCGHTAQKSGIPADVGFGICLDTWVYGRGWLTCFHVETGEYWQANQAGQTRKRGENG